MKKPTFAGVRIARGPGDWQIVQRRLDCVADIPLAGSWNDPKNRPAAVEVRVADARTQVAAAPHLDWSEAETNPDRSWRHTLRDVPAGGPYRVETRLRTAGDAWRLNGDSIRHLGVGDLWIIAGDDNAVGFGSGEADDPPEPGVHVFRRNGGWTLADHPLHDGDGVRGGRFFSAGKAGHSPWLAFGRALRRSLGIPIGLIPAGLAGCGLVEWTGEDGSAPALENMLEMVRSASSWRNYADFDPLDGAPRFLPPPGGRTGSVAGVAWHQGNEDARSGEAAERYGAAFRAVVDIARVALSSPSLPFITCQLNRVLGVASHGEGEFWSRVREAQRAAMHDVPGVAAVPTLDAGLSDGIHNSARGNLVVGARAARAALGMAYGKALPWKFPDLKSVFFEEGGRTAVIVEFANVSGGLWPASHEIASFAVADKSGKAAVRRAEITGSARLRILLNRELGEAPVLSFCPGFNPEAVLFDGNHCPPLAFHRIAIGEAPTTEER